VEEWEIGRKNKEAREAEDPGADQAKTAAIWSPDQTSDMTRKP
jgi:hypothetical protein